MDFYLTGWLKCTSEGRARLRGRGGEDRGDRQELVSRGPSDDGKSF